MNRKKLAGRIATVALTSVMVFGTVGFTAGCKKENDKLVIMSEALDGLFNPFFSTAGPDMEVVGMTQLSMLSTNSKGDLAYGKDEATVVLDYKSEYDKTAGDTGNGITTHYFVLKNNLTFSDGKPLTMNDVLFNMYVYLDPVYTGSTTMYSTDIVGLKEYRTQSNNAGSGDDNITKEATNYAELRVLELRTVYEEKNKAIWDPQNQSFNVPKAEMEKAIDDYNGFTPGYKDAVSYKTLTDEEYRKQLKEDYNLVLTTFQKELESDFESAKDSYKDTTPYKETGFFKDEVFSFMFMEGYVNVKTTGWTDNTHTAIKPGKDSFDINYDQNSITTKEQAINYVFNNKISAELPNVMNYYATANTIRNDYIAKAKDNILHKSLNGRDDLIIPNVEGIVSMGHDVDVLDTTVTIGNTTYKIAKEYKEDGTVKNDNEYAVLRVQVNGVDPKAVWNFGFTVAPYHYYSDTSKYPMDIAHDKFGVAWSSFDFMKTVIQGDNAYGESKNQVPLGAGAYIATDSDNADFSKVKGNTFNSNGSVYFKANSNFIMGEPKIKNVVYQVVASTDALNVLESGSVHFVTPQLTPANQNILKNLEKKGFESTSTWNLGYGYIGVNAGKVPDINLRKAIMSAMDVSLVKSYYSFGTSENIAWPMSIVSWAYPRDEKGFNTSDPTLNMDNNNGKSWLQFPNGADTTANNETAKQKIKSYTGSKANTAETKLKFTIAGANLTEHPVYAVFTKAAELLNACGWQVEVVPDNNALTKLATGSLAVWAAAWGSTNDPDMYQVYHKNSTATSVLSWGYREILSQQSAYSYENGILNQLAVKIDEGRQTADKDQRTAIYKEAMGLVLDLAVEMPAYQRRELFAYNAKVIDTNTFPDEINSYSSPLGKIWEIDFVK